MLEWMFSGSSAVLESPQNSHCHGGSNEKNITFVKRECHLVLRGFLNRYNTCVCEFVCVYGYLRLGR